MTWTGERSARLPSDWLKRRAYVLERDGYSCYVCGKPGADQVDHVQPGADHSSANLAAIHDNPCHRRKSAREGAAARLKRVRPPETHPGVLT